MIIASNGRLYGKKQETWISEAMMSDGKDK